MREKNEAALTIRLPTELMDELKVLSDLEDRTITGMIRRILLEYVRKTNQSG